MQLRGVFNLLILQFTTLYLRKKWWCCNNNSIIKIFDNSMKRWNDELLHTCNKASGVLCWDHCSTAFASSPEHRSCQKKSIFSCLMAFYFHTVIFFLLATVNSEFSPWKWAGNNLRVATVLGCVCRTEPEKEDDISCCFFLSLWFVWIWSKLCL